MCSWCLLGLCFKLIHFCYFLSPECLLCQTGWIFFSESCYFISDVSLTWDQSRAFCQLKSADLIVINNQQEQEFIYYNINTNTDYWLGLRNNGSNWVWIDGRIDTLGCFPLLMLHQNFLCGTIKDIFSSSCNIFFI
uniref:C-type lectin domain-containing protein n=1 Tax=Xiphophorus couchianus TaxID=32473 RepID=A0A3B5L568_9TELE